MLVGMPHQATTWPYQIFKDEHPIILYPIVTPKIKNTHDN